MSRQNPWEIPPGVPMSNPLLKPPAQNPPRAKRFAIQVPVLFRQTGQISWSQGRSENISRSGILFCSEEEVEIGTHLELSFKLRGEEMGGEEGAMVICQAQIVRRVLPPAPDAPPALAARILDYRLMREQNNQAHA